MLRPYAILNVFTDEPLAGNPLAVVLESSGLDDALMQKIAGEFNLSETVFVTGFEDGGLRAPVRIFTPGGELPFAGHPTVGTAILLALEAGLGEGSAPAQKVILEERIGAVHCDVKVGDGRGSGRFTLPQLPSQVGETRSKEAIAAALGLSASDIGFGSHQPARWSGGAPFTIVPVEGLEAIRRIEPESNAWASAFGSGHHNNAFVYSSQCENADSHFHARMFWPAAGIKEDPATGSAVAAFAGAVMAYKKPSDGIHLYRIEQGFEMGRPSLIELQLDIKDGALVTARIGGEAVVTARGNLMI